uniref:Laminin G domain-containing protein n=1 Tax=Vespula pensylvanica TaxID=30213 RepID=A0A834NYU4_VESPE|nr:hypothetical protein H0235_009481 [Vespula pensylvanica]
MRKDLRFPRDLVTLVPKALREITRLILHGLLREQREGVGRVRGKDERKRRVEKGWEESVNDLRCGNGHFNRQLGAFKLVAAIWLFAKAIKQRLMAFLHHPPRCTFVCSHDKVPSEASFRGTEYLTIDLSKGDPILSTQESVGLQFKTRQPNGLFFYSGVGDDYLTVSLRDGGVAVGMTLAKGRLDLHIKPARIRFDDNQWHKIIVHRKVQEVR